MDIEFSKKDLENLLEKHLGMKVRVLDMDLRVDEAEEENSTLVIEFEKR